MRNRKIQRALKKAERLEKERTVMERIKYKFIFRTRGEEPVIVVHDTRPGDAENCARKLAKLVAKREKWPDAECAWMGPEDQRLPEKIREAMRRERTA